LKLNFFNLRKKAKFNKFLQPITRRDSEQVQRGAGVNKHFRLEKMSEGSVGHWDLGLNALGTV
jgi:hypothetical protein